MTKKLEMNHTTVKLTGSNKTAETRSERDVCIVICKDLLDHKNEDKAFVSVTVWFCVCDTEMKAQSSHKEKLTETK